MGRPSLNAETACKAHAWKYLLDTSTSFVGRVVLTWLGTGDLGKKEAFAPPHILIDPRHDAIDGGRECAFYSRFNRKKRAEKVSSLPFVKLRLALAQFPRAKSAGHLFQPGR